MGEWIQLFHRGFSMKKTTARIVCSLATAALALVSLNTAFAQQKPVKKVVDFNAAAPMASPLSYFGASGVVVKIASASIASDGTITARLTIADPNGVPLDRLGVLTPGPVSISLIAATIPAGQTQYVAYTTTVLKSTLNDNPAQTQAAADSGGTFTQNALGDYTYVFKTKAPTGFDAKATHSIGVYAYRNLTALGDYAEWLNSANDIFDFVPNGAKVSVTRNVMATAACNQCHDPLYAHGGTRVEVKICVMCHTPQTINPDTKLPQDMKVLIHKIHRGSSLPSVVAGTPYRIWHRGAWSDFSDVTFPQDIRNCTTCHAGGAPDQVDNWKTKPSRAACGSCHDDVDFATGKNHVNYPVNDDATCSQCHGATKDHDFDASVPGAHVVPNQATAMTGLVVKILSVKNTGPGQQPVVTFSVTNKAGDPVDIAKLTSFRLILGGPNVDYGTGPGGIRVSETLSGTSITGSGGQYTYTMTNKIPAAAAGSYTVSAEAYNTMTLMAGTTKQQTANTYAMPVQYYFSVDSSAVTPRRQVVATQNCSTCHKDLTFVHSGSRPNTQECVICHNPALADGTTKMSVNFAVQIHSTHRGNALENPYTIAGTNYQEVGYPGDLKNCSKCHMNSSYQIDKMGAKAAVSTPGGFQQPTTPPITAVCTGCHDDQATASHAMLNTSKLGESCVICHGNNGQFSVDKVHVRQ
jgi:OmcA/MtrC family decaheme c-type cytochrome